jgi:hypothetical protein
VSYDPGRFVCNYLFYSSLQHCADRGNAAVRAFGRRKGILNQRSGNVCRLLWS